jgi:hypothetical protein
VELSLQPRRQDQNNAAPMLMMPAQSAAETADQTSAAKGRDQRSCVAAVMRRGECDKRSVNADIADLLRYPQFER